MKGWRVTVWLGLSTLAVTPSFAENGASSVGFSLARVVAQAGSEVDLPMAISSSQHLSMVAVTVEYDPAELEFVQPILAPALVAILDPAADGASLYELFRDDVAGWFQLAVVADFEGRVEFSLPPGLLTSAFSFRFRVREDVASGEYSVRFTRDGSAAFDGFFHDGTAPVYNAARFAGRAFERSQRFREVEDPIVEDGAILVPIIGDVGVFVRGDANLDLSVDLADPVRTLDALFRSGAPLRCLSAADANADGAVNLSDPILVLRYLFSSESNWVPSVVRVGDLSEDELGCNEPAAAS